MQVTLASALQSLNESRPNAILDIINAARPPATYIGAMILPEVSSFSYFAKAGRMTLRPTMATPTGLSSPFNKSGTITTSTFAHSTFKFTNEVPLNEESLREFQQITSFSTGTPQQVTQQVVETLLNFTEKMLLQSHLDAAEWARWEALSEGAIQWNYNGEVLDVIYNGMNKNTTRTGNDKYAGSTSKFWDDVKWAQRTLKHNVFGFFVNANTYAEIIGNEVNKTVPLGGSVKAGKVMLGKYRGTSTSDLERDSSFTIELYVVSGETEILNPATPGINQLKSFLKDGKMVAIGDSSSTGSFRVGLGSAGDLPPQAIGITHLGPTVEGNGQPGRWGRVFVPQDAEWSLIGRAASNFIPVIEAPEKVAICTTDMS